MNGKGGFIYIMTNKHHTALYIGVTSDIAGRIYDHKNHIYKNSFTDRYNIEYLVYYEQFETITQAIDRETEVKKWRRAKKEALVNQFNSDWKDLYDDIMLW